MNRWWNKKGNTKRQPGGEEGPTPIQATDDSTVHGVPKYDFKVLAEATGDFSNNNRLGQGGVGQVYKGKLPNDNKVVAIKRLIHHSDPEIEKLAQLQFEVEVKTLSRIRHRNIVKVVGYCSDKADRLLVYEFVSNNSLKSHLNGKGKTSQETETQTIDWSNRMKIALGTAKGLAYLHEDCDPRIIHRDIKSDNILLNDEFEPKIGDFGISKDFPDSATHISTETRGTHAYAPPEYYIKDGQHRKLTDKSDVFSFGIVLLELITGKLALFEKKRKDYIRLAVWAIPLLKQVLDIDKQDLDVEDCKDLFDSKLQKKYNKDEMMRMIYCAAACIYKPVKLRPKMSQIVEVLKGNMEPKNIWAKNDSKYLYEGSPYAQLPPLPEETSDS
ncbi:proline-rich receptor-like protein kinase PERK2 [Hevea brasiliensis]|uniref:proline-rich receptor-like protein kinase PERK2 n=1 Tax=Hevea brasiliensis TaxID=3981 RepID=UPI0025FF6980|nr:proline-rich receptor-like protein kinase PERK2 [Hevea brasiliensis]